jgi:hypothetical protein
MQVQSLAGRTGLGGGLQHVDIDRALIGSGRMAAEIGDLVQLLRVAGRDIQRFRIVEDARCEIHDLGAQRADIHGVAHQLDPAAFDRGNEA